MVKHKPMCWVVSLLVVIGGLNWGLVGLDNLLGSNLNLNVVNRLFGSWPIVESIVYLLVGVAALFMGYMFFTEKTCACQKM